jgi:hypothetical protein
MIRVIERPWPFDSGLGRTTMKLVRPFQQKATCWCLKLSQRGDGRLYNKRNRVELENKWYSSLVRDIFSYAKWRPVMFDLQSKEVHTTMPEVLLRRLVAGSHRHVPPIQGEAETTRLAV